MTRQQREIDDAEHIVDRVVMFGDAERPADNCPIRASIRMRKLADERTRYPRDLLRVFQRVWFDRCVVTLEPCRRALDENPILETRMDDLSTNPVGERDIRANVQPEPRVRPRGRGRLARVDGVQ